MRIAAAQDWILANADHPNVPPYGREEPVAALSALSPDHALAAPFLQSQLRKFQTAYGHIDEGLWGAAERRRVYKIEYELIILIETKGEETVWEPGMWARHAAFVLRRQTTEWLIAGSDGKIPHPGWPPTLEDFPTDGVTFADNPSDPSSK